MVWIVYLKTGGVGCRTTWFSPWLGRPSLLGTGKGNSNSPTLLHPDLCPLTVPGILLPDLCPLTVPGVLLPDLCPLTVPGVLLPDLRPLLELSVVPDPRLPGICNIQDILS